MAKNPPVKNLLQSGLSLSATEKGNALANMGIGTGSQYITNAGLLQGAAWQKLLNRARGGIDQQCLVLGDSTDVGYGSNATGNGTAAVPGTMRQTSMPAQLARALNAMGIPARGEGFLGNGALHSTGYTHLYDTGHLTVPAGWGDGVATLGGFNWIASAAPAGPIVFTALEPVDTFDIYYLQNSSFGSLTWALDGGAPTTVSCAGTVGMGKLTVSATSVSGHSVSIGWAAGSIYICGVDAYRKTRKGLTFLNCAVNGGNASDALLNVNFWDPLKLITSMQPPMVMLGWGPNYWNYDGVSTTYPGGAAYVTNLANFTSSLGTLIDAVKTYGGLVLMHTSYPSNPSGTGIGSLALQQQYVDAKVALAVSKGVVCFDTWRAFGSNWSTQNALGGYYDDIHPSGGGYGIAIGVMAKALAFA